MKLNQKTKAAIKNKPAKSKSKGSKAKAIVKAVVKLIVPDKLTGKAVALLSGTRGFAARLVETGKLGNVTVIRALQRNDGLSLKDGVWCPIEAGILTGIRQGRIELGGYVNGKSTGAKVELLSENQFTSKAKVGLVKWNSKADAKPIAGMYLGNMQQKGMLAVRTVFQKGHAPFFWQVEQDSNANNKHERGKVSQKQSAVKAKVPATA